MVGMATRQVQRFLLVEGQHPIRLDLELTLRRRFPKAEIERHFLTDTFTDTAVLPALDWQAYDVVLLSCPASICTNLSCLRAIKKHGGRKPVVVVMTQNADLGRRAVWEGADMHWCLSDSNTEFAVRFDAVLEVGRMLQRYPLELSGWYLLEMLHDSENAVIFLAENREGERAVIKRFKFDVSGLEPAIFSDFLSSAQRLSTLQHPGLVKILDAGVTCHAIYLVMEYIEGHTLKSLLSEYECPELAHVLPWFRQVTSALVTVHALSLLHRDLKASNVLVRADGTVVLLDFGVENQLLVDTGFLSEDEIYCTPFYVSPERIAGEPATVQSDLYALGILLYEMLSGEKPFVGSHLGDILQQHLFDPTPPLPPAVAAFQPLVEHLLAKSPDARPDSAAVVLVWLDAYAQTLSADKRR